MDKATLGRMKSSLTTAVGLLDQATYHGQQNTYIFYNVFGYLNNVLAEIDKELEIEQLNSEVPKKEQKEQK